MTTELTKPIYTNPDPKATETIAIQRWEDTTNKPLYPAQPERLMINQIAYWLNLYLSAVQYTGEQELINYAIAGNLDQLGAMLDCARLTEISAQTTLKFTVQETTNVRRVFPIGIRVGSKDTDLIFTTTYALSIPAYQSTGEVIAECETKGEIGNGFITDKFTEFKQREYETDFISVTNIDETYGGYDDEEDDRYRARLKLAPQKFATTGSQGAYEFWALTASNLVKAVAINSPRRTIVNLYVLSVYGTADATLIQKVYNTVNSETVRPLTDVVTVYPAIPKTYSIIAKIYLKGSGLTEPAILQQIRENAGDFASEKMSLLGQDIIPDEIVSRLFISGVYDITLIEPSENLIVGYNEWAECQEITLTVEGYNLG